MDCALLILNACDTDIKYKELMWNSEYPLGHFPVLLLSFEVSHSILGMSA